MAAPEKPEVYASIEDYNKVAHTYGGPRYNQVPTVEECVKNGWGGPRIGAGAPMKVDRRTKLLEALDKLEKDVDRNINFLKKVRDNSPTLTKIYGGNIPLNIRMNAAKILMDKTLPNREKVEISDSEGKSFGNIFILPAFIPVKKDA